MCKYKQIAVSLYNKFSKDLLNWRQEFRIVLGEKKWIYRMYNLEIFKDEFKLMNIKDYRLFYSANYRSI